MEHRVLGDRTRQTLDCSKDVPVTKQSFKDECDINVLMESYKRTGVLEHLARGLPSYGDFSNAADYHTASTQVLEAQRAFDELPSKIRNRMDNDPHKLLAFLEDESNRDEAVELGLLTAPPKVEPPVETGAPEGKRAPDSAGGEAAAETETEVKTTGGE